jgi:hypothetical protein
MTAGEVFAEAQEYARAYAAEAEAPSRDGPSGDTDAALRDAVRRCLMQIFSDPDFKAKLAELMSGSTAGPSQPSGYPQPSTPGVDLRNLHPTRQTPAGPHIPKHEPYLGSPGSYGMGELDR